MDGTGTAPANDNVLGSGAGTTEEEEVEVEINESPIALASRQGAAAQAETLAGHCLDMAAALRDKAKAIRARALRHDVLAAHRFNEAARQFKAALAKTDRTHRSYLLLNRDVGRTETDEPDED